MRKRMLQQRQEEERLRMQEERQRQMSKQQEEEKRRAAEEERRQEELAQQEKQQQIYMQNQYRTYASNYGHIKQPASDDIEDQIEASTISFSSGEDGTNKRITIKFKKERTVETHEIRPAPETPAVQQPPIKVPGKKKSTQSRVKYSVLSSYDQPAAAAAPKFNGATSTTNNGFKTTSQMEDANLLLSFSGANDDSTSTTSFAAVAAANDDSFSSFSNNENSCNGFGSSTPARQPAKSKNWRKNLSFINDDSQSSEMTYIEDDEETRRRKLEKATQTIDTHLSRKSIDPFSSELCKAFLTKANFPNPSVENCSMLNHTMSKFVKGADVTLGGKEFYVDREVGRGTYGSVYRALNTTTNEIVALKYQKPANSWEFYVCQEVRKRCINADLVK